MKKIQNIAVGLLAYFMFSYGMFLGLQVSPMLGNIGVVMAGVFLLAYVFLKNKKVHIINQYVSAGVLILVLGMVYMGAMFVYSQEIIKKLSEI